MPLGNDRTFLLDTWDRVVAGQRWARVVSHVYGRTFPLGALPPRRSGSIVVIGYLEGLVALQRELAPYSTTAEKRRIYFHGTAARGTMSKVGGPLGVALAAAALLGVGVLGVGAYASRSSSTKRSHNDTNNLKGAFGQFLSLFNFGGS